MTIKTVTLALPDPDQPLSELTRDEKADAFKQLAAVVSRLDTRRRALYRLLAAADQRAKARQILDRLTPEVQEALKVELELKS